MKALKKNKIDSLTRFEHHPIISIIIVNGFLFILFLIFLEISLRTYAPIGFTNVGYLHSPNGLKYGWGFSPNDVVRIENPDTGKVFYDRVNNNGWRDRNRSYSNTRNSFRVIVIGDSEVFGYIVPKEKTYTFLLEERFKKEGKNVEIINIAYSGWGTSQQLEVLGKEATKYNPDLVIIHFVGNDLYDNVIHLDKSKFSYRIPFFHEVSVTGELYRRDNPKFLHEQNSITRAYLISKSEVLKRLWLSRLILKNRLRKEYIIATGQINLLHLIFGDKLPKDFIKEIENLNGKHMNKTELSNLVERFQLSNEQKKVILRISENRGFLRDFNGFGLYRKPKYTNTSFWRAEEKKDKYRWLLYTKIMKEMKSILKNKNIPFAITSDYGPKRYDWATYWFLASGAKIDKINFLKMNNKLERFAVKNGILFITPSKNDHRARNDPHLNERGHQAAAENLYKYLSSKFEKKILLK